jgi:dihydrolipoamide dehydrogenase
MTKTTKYDICIIGCGPAGFAAAVRAHDFGKKCCVIERKRLGGAGLHNGALSSKTMYHLSTEYQNLFSSRIIDPSSIKVEFEKIKQYLYY